jgi:Ulp1 family protease
MRYGQLFFRQQQDVITGIYPMNMPGHWRVMIVSHDLRQMLLLDPFGNGFTVDEFDNVKYSYSGYKKC